MTFLDDNFGTQILQIRQIFTDELTKTLFFIRKIIIICVL